MMNNSAGRRRKERCVTKEWSEGALVFGGLGVVV